MDSVGWAESVSQSAGRDLMKQILPEFDAKFEVHSGKETKVRIFLIPKGEIVRSSVLSFHTTTIPRILLIRAASRTEEAMQLRGAAQPGHFQSYEGNSFSGFFYQKV